MSSYPVNIKSVRTTITRFMKFSLAPSMTWYSSSSWFRSRERAGKMSPFSSKSGNARGSVYGWLDVPEGQSMRSGAGTALGACMMRGCLSMGK